MRYRLQNYFATLSAGRLILWFYFIWYLVVAIRYFDPSPSIWITSIGLGFIIGTALLINARGSGEKKVDRWPAFRFFLTPFCVSSFSALVKGKGFILIFSPRAFELLIAVLLCGTFWLLAAVVRFTFSDPSPMP